MPPVCTSLSTIQSLIFRNYLLTIHQVVFQCELVKVCSCPPSLCLSCVCVSVSQGAHVWVHVQFLFFFFFASGDPLLCQLFPMMLNSNRNIVSGENDFILWKTILPYSFISLRLPRSPLIPHSGFYSRLYSLYQCLPLYLWITCALGIFYPWLIFFSSAVSLFFLLSLSLSALKILCVFLSQMLGW